MFHLYSHLHMTQFTPSMRQQPLLLVQRPCPFCYKSMWKLLGTSHVINIVDMWCSSRLFIVFTLRCVPDPSTRCELRGMQCGVPRHRSANVPVLRPVARSVFGHTSLTLASGEKVKTVFLRHVLDNILLQITKSPISLTTIVGYFKIGHPFYAVGDPLIVAHLPGHEPAEPARRADIEFPNTQGCRVLVHGLPAVSVAAR